VSLKLNADNASLADQFSRLRTFSDVARLLEIEPVKLRYYLHRSNNYKVFTLQKRTGGKRVISTPITPLKIIQRKLNQVFHAVYGGRSPVHGFIRKKSIVTNASRHVDRQWLLNFDLENFFPSINFGRVKGLLEGKPYLRREAVAVTLAQICCHEGSLPVGAPTSPVVANMVCAQMDAQLKRLAIDCGCRYTRYADDITFSVSRGRFPPAITYRDPTSRKWVIGDELSGVIRANGFTINSSKTRVLPRGYRQEVTGLVVGERVNVKRKFLRQVRAMLHATERWGVAGAAAHFDSKYDRRQRLKKPDFLRVLRGKIEFVGSVRGRDDIIYLLLLDRYLELDKKARVRRVVATAAASPEVVERAIWLLEEREGPVHVQGTGFAAEGIGLITAAHVVTATTEASCPAINVPGLAIRVDRKDDHVDVARLSLASRLPVRLKLGSSAQLKVGEAVKVLGFPLHRDGGSVNVENGKITAASKWHGVPHFVVDCAIVQGNSGGPVLNDKNEVIGIAVKGQGVPKRFAGDDEMSRFVPIDFALPFLTIP
jgi:RNA-directed DNA polymerase